MKRAPAITSCLVSGCLLVFFSPLQATVTFDDSSDPLVLSNSSYYEIGFSADDGAITYIQDKSTGNNICRGNTLGDLWRLKFRDSGLLRAATFSALSSVYRFSYSWDPVETRLTLQYDSDFSGDELGMTVVFDATDGNVMDISATVMNEYNDAVETVYLPSELAFDMNNVEQFFMPYYEGVAFQRSFFQELRSTFQPYQHIFTDFGALESTDGNMALYVLPGAAFQPATVGLGYSGWSGGVSVYHHMFQTYIADKESWDSPVLRLVIGREINKTVAEFRNDRGWNSTPGLKDLVGPLYKKLAEAFLVKMDIQHVHDWGWAGGSSAFAWADSIADVLPDNALLHLVAFWPGGFDNHYPDYLPPAPEYGSDQEFRDLLQNARSRGQMVMPYTNPTWWNEDSPTFDSLGVGIAAQTLTGTPVYECYGSNCGYVVSPSNTDVKQRQRLTVEEFRHDYVVDILFEDQVADRPWMYDTNTSAENYMCYTDALVDNAGVASSTIPLATEGMLDALLGSEIGFYDSVILDKKAGWISSWGTDNWVTYPITMLAAHDKATFYQHNLAVEVMCHSKEMLTYNLSYGFGLNFDLTDAAGMMDSEWLPIDEVFQRTIASRFAGRLMTDFEYLDTQKKVSWTQYDNLEIVGNHDSQNSYDYNDYTLVPQGLYAATGTDHLIGGVFSRFNGVDLPGEHFIVVEKTEPRMYTVDQPHGPDATIRVDRPSWWSRLSQIRVRAISASSDTNDVTNLATTIVTPDYIEFLWARNPGSETIRHYNVQYTGSQGEQEVTGIADRADSGLPSRAFVSASPNPFNPSTTIHFGLPSAGSVSLDLFDSSGRRVRQLIRKDLEAGYHDVIWEGRDDAGRNVGSGVYFSRLRAGDDETTARLVLIR